MMKNGFLSFSLTQYFKKEGLAFKTEYAKERFERLREHITSLFNAGILERKEAEEYFVRLFGNFRSIEPYHYNTK